MPYTYDQVESLFNKGLIDAKDRSLLRGQVIQRNNQVAGLGTMYIQLLSKEVSDNWGALVKITKSHDASLTAGAETALHALALITSPVTTALRLPGEDLFQHLVKGGANPNVAALAGMLGDLNNVILTKAALSAPAKIKAWVDAFKKSPEIKVALEAILEAPKNSAANLIDVIYKVDKPQDVALPGKAGILVTERKALPAPSIANESAAVKAEAEAMIESVNAKMKQMDSTHDLLAKAQETLQPAVQEVSETTRTLDAAAATMRGGETTAEQLLNNKQLIDARAASDNLLKRVKTGRAPRGGVPGYDEYLAAGKRAQEAYAEGKKLLESGKINIEETIKQAGWVGKTLPDLQMITGGEAVDPIEIISNSLAVKVHQKELWSQLQGAEEAWMNGNKAPFYQVFAEFNKLLEVDPKYRMPLQTAGQTLRVAGQPMVNATRYQDRLTNTGSWIAGEKLNSISELEANAVNIIRRLQAMGDPDKVAVLAKKIAATDPEELIKPGFRDYARFFFVNSIMSGTDTIGRNIFGNLVAAPWHYAEKLIGATASKTQALNPFKSAEHYMEYGYASEANSFVGTWAASMWDASRYALTRKWDKLAEMVPESARADLFAGRYDLPKFTTTGTTNPFTGLTGQVFGTPVGIAQEADAVARVALYRGAVSERLRHEWLATKSTLPWGEFREHGMANIAPDIHEYGIRLAGEMTYSDKPSVFGRLLMQAREAIPGTEFMLPFIKTTDRLGAYQWNRSPVLSAISSRTLKELQSTDPLVRQEMVGRILLANVAGAGLFLAARAKAPDGETFITGGGPTDRKLAGNLRDAEVIHPYTIWTPAGRLPFRLLQPAGGVLGIIADAASIWDELKSPDAEALWSGIVLAGSRNFFDTTYNQQIANVVSIFDNPRDEGNVERIGRQMGASVIKGFVEPAIVRQAFRAYDPTVKEVYDFWGELTREVPGYGAPAKINPRTGEPVMNPPRLLQGTPMGWFLPTAPIQSDNDKVAQKFRDLGLPFPKFPKAYMGSAPSTSSFAYSGPLGIAKEAGAGVPYTPEQINKGMRYIHDTEDSGMTPSQEVEALIADPEFNKLAPVVQAEQLTAIYNSRIDRAVGKVVEEHPEILTQYEQILQRRGEARMSEDERAGFIAEENAPPDVRQQEEPLNFPITDLQPQDPGATP